MFEVDFDYKARILSPPRAKYKDEDFCYLVRVRVGISVLWSTTSCSMFSGKTLAVRNRVSVGDSVLWSSTSASMFLDFREIFAVSGRVNVGDSILWSIPTDSVNIGVTLADRDWFSITVSDQLAQLERK